MPRDKIRNKDLTNNSIDGSKIIDGTITINDIKKTGINNISGATLSYDGINITPTIKEKIDNIVNLIDYTIEEFVGNGNITDFDLSNRIDISVPYLIFANGILQKQGDNYDYILINDNQTIHFNYIPEYGINITIIYQKL